MRPPAWIARIVFITLHLLLVVGVTFACAGSTGGSSWMRALLILPALLSLLPLPFAVRADVKGHAGNARTLLLSVMLSLPVSIVLLLLLLLFNRLGNASWH
ncbi:hypothetical protein F2P44_27575 [Massilia sp. CCM 8695]|uniref:DUF805 domain-containing protein n=1 Tax=Massilia frigida TaxID=2609281 RepID=A0ABX0NHU4_9BURK|nr:hypothetical protein [Massilia frigida]NHZ83009.1 hypothetical protein [Massilia frigida]